MNIVMYEYYIYTYEVYMHIYIEMYVYTYIYSRAMSTKRAWEQQYPQ